MGRREVKLEAIQHLRGFAALLVVMHHALTPAQGMSFADRPTFGPAGVDIFFVLSGFIIYTSQADKRDLADFAYRRFVRVAPLYWFFTGALLAMHYMIGVNRDLVVSPGALAQSMLFIPHFNETEPGHIWPILIPGWSLNYEMFFYFVFGLAMLTRRPLAVLLGGIAALVLVGAALHPTNPILATYTSPLLLEFAAGVAIGAAYKRFGFGRSLAYALIPAGLLLLVLTDPLHIPRLIGWGGAGALLVAGCAAASWRFRPAAVLGDASYSIYLSHILALPFLRVAWNAANLPASTVAFGLAALGFCSAVGIGSFYLLERPMLRALTRRRDSLPAAAARTA